MTIPIFTTSLEEMMRCFSSHRVIGIRLAASLATLVSICAIASAQEPKPFSDMQKEGQLTDKLTDSPPSQLKPVQPLFPPTKEMEDGEKVTSNYRKPSRLKAGVFSPNSNSLRKATNQTYAAFGASLDLPPYGLTKPFTPEVYIDGAYHHDRTHDTEATRVGAGIGFRSYPGAKPGFTTQHPRPYFGAGIGLYYVQMDLQGAQDNKTQLGGKAVAGLDLADNWSVEVSYTLTGKLDGTDLGGPALLFAYRL